MLSSVGELNFDLNKKVLLRERKRHTARRVVSPPSVVLTGYPPHLTGYPPGGVPDWVPPRGGTWTPLGVPPRGGTRTPQGVPDRVPPRGGTRPPRGGTRTPPLPHGILGNVAKHYGIWVPPPGVDRQTK